MSVEEYELLPFEPGWKCEYHEGQAYFTPRDHPVITSLQVAPRPVNAPCLLRAVRATEAGQLIEAYLAAFGATIEYCDYSNAKLEQAAQRALADHFSGERGNPLSASRVAVAPGAAATLLGAALLIAGRDSARLDLLFVHPAWQGRGLATALVADAVNHLHLYGEARLLSRYHIGNDASRRWHQRFGFVEEPDLQRARLYRTAVRQELWRRERLGELPPEERRRLQIELAAWQAQVDELERRAEEQGYEAVCALYRW
ncbi:MAG: GNAT family N-acetyltransferase [Deltaproteobacteria bacterium]|nr:GNAT family N-acetyltransferase [Deltaproteobacteria bacterium]